MSSETGASCMQPEAPPWALWLQLAEAVCRSPAPQIQAIRCRGDLCCFHCQHAAEKALKAVLVAHGAEFPKTHSLAYLTKLLSDCGVPVPDAVHSAAGLSEYTVESRYPDELVEASPAMLEEAVDLARAVVAWTENTLRSR